MGGGNLEAEGGENTKLLESGQGSRLDYLKKIGEARDSLVVAYLTSVRAGRQSSIVDDDVRIMERHLDIARKKNIRNIDLILCTNGGDAAMPWNFHAMFRDYFPKGRLGVFVPYVAYSAGTIICLGSDEIILGRKSVLGPVDLQTGGFPLSNSFSSFMSLLKEIDPQKRLRPREKLEALTKNMSAIEAGFFYRNWKENRRLISNALRSRRSPLSEFANRRITEYFINEVGYHSQGIRRREALDAGVSFITELEVTRLELQLDTLFSAYASAMKLFDPLADPRIQCGEDNGPSDEGPIAIIESIYDSNIAYPRCGVERGWSTPVYSADDSNRNAPAVPWSVHWTARNHPVGGITRQSRDRK